MPFQKGHKKTGGRKKGQIDKLTQTVNQLIIEVQNDLGGKKHLMKFAKDYPDVFYGRLFAKLIKQNVDLNVEGDLVVHWQQ